MVGYPGCLLSDYVASGSLSSDRHRPGAHGMSASRRKRTSRTTSREVRFVPKADISMLSCGAKVAATAESTRQGARHSGLDREVGIEHLADLDHLLAGETAAGGKLGDRFEVMILPTRQAPSQHASCDAADVLEAV